MSEHRNPPAVQEMPIEGLTGIEIRAPKLDLVVESDNELSGVARLLAEPDAGAPVLAIHGKQLTVSQDGRYRGTSPPVLKLPGAALPPIAARISRGNLTIEDITATLAINLSSGNCRVSGGAGDTAINVSSGDATIQRREGQLACRIDSGNLSVAGYRGDIAVNMSKGDIDLNDCRGTLNLRIDKGDVSIARPIEQDLRISVAKGDINIQGGSLTSTDVDVTRGDIRSTARLLYTELAKPDDEPDEPGGFEDAIDDVVDALDEEVRFNLGSVQFIASDAGVRLSAGGTERFVAGPEGVQVRRADGTPVFSASEKGINLGPTGRRGSEHFRFQTRRGSISVDVSDNQPARVELIVNSGSVQSDIPLVEVGRPGPRSSTRRYVGVSDSSETDRILIRAITNRGDIRVKAASPPQATSRPASTTARERQRRQILEALARGRITTDEADILLAAMERESG